MLVESNVPRHEPSPQCSGHSFPVAFVGPLVGDGLNDFLEIVTLGEASVWHMPSRARIDSKGRLLTRASHCYTATRLTTLLLTGYSCNSRSVTAEIPF